MSEDYESMPDLPPPPPPPPPPVEIGYEVEQADAYVGAISEVSTERDYGFYGDGPHQGLESFDEALGGVYSEGTQQGTLTPSDLPGGFYSDRPLGDAERA